MEVSKRKAFVMMDIDDTYIEELANRLDEEIETNPQVLKACYLKNNTLVCVIDPTELSPTLLNDFTYGLGRLPHEVMYHNIDDGLSILSKHLGLSKEQLYFELKQRDKISF